jgi:DNA-directed RNA polymerase specialized sigma24 family protein
MPEKETVERNKEIVILRRDKGWTFRKIAAFFNIDVKTVYRAYKRDLNKY